MVIVENLLLMKENIFMRVLFCKIHCPFICFCKPSAAAHLYTSGPLKLENTTQAAPCRVVSVSDSSDQSFGETAKVKEESLHGKDNADKVLKSCIKKAPTTVTPPPDAIEETEKKRVQWVDNLGKELAEIKEFECRVFVVCDWFAVRVGTMILRRKTDLVVFVSSFDLMASPVFLCNFQGGAGGAGSNHKTNYVK